MANVTIAQSQAIETIEGPVLIVAGPGTGKTHTLTLRLANILATAQVEPENLLALSFSNAAAREMQQRLVDLIGPPATKITFATFHSFASGVIADHPEHFPIDPRWSEPIGEWELWTWLEKILEKPEFSAFRPLRAPDTYIREIVGMLGHYKREGISPDDLEQRIELLRESAQASALSPSKLKTPLGQLEKLALFLPIYRLYQDWLAVAGRYDLDNLIWWVRDAFAHNDELRAEYEERYQYVQVDEFQDTNGSQLQLLTNLLQQWGGQANLAVVGDPNQAIYRFQGAFLQSAEVFLQHFPQAEVISLDTSFRCGARLTQAAAAVMAAEKEQLNLPESLQSWRAPLQSRQGHDTQLHKQQFDQRAQEHAWLIGQIAMHRSQGLPAKEIAVLVTKNNEVRELADLFAQHDIPYQVTRTADALEDQVVQHLLRLGTALSHWIAEPQQSAQTLWAVLFAPWLKLPSAEIVWWAQQKTLPKWLQSQEELPKEVSERWLWLREQWQNWLRLGQAPNLTTSLDEWLVAMEFWPWLYQANVPVATLAAIRVVLSSAQEWMRSDRTMTLDQWWRRLEECQRLQVTLPVPIDLNTDAITISTVHGSKGREWDVVFLPHLEEGWGKGSNAKLNPDSVLQEILAGEKGGKEADLRRLFYVAITRARKFVYVSHAVFSSDLAKKSSKINPFVVDVPTELWQGFHDSTLLPLIPGPRKLQDWHANINRVWLEEAVRNHSLSVSSWAELETCPLQFVWRRLWRLPSTQTAAATLGTAVHSVLEQWGRQHITAEPIAFAQGLQQLLTIVQHSLLSEVEQRAVLEKAQSMLSKLQENIDKELINTVAVEVNIGGQRSVTWEGLPLIGKLDRLDLNADGTHMVIDYKTGAKHSRPEILQGKKGHPPLHRQLVFYRLLSELLVPQKYRITQGRFFFLDDNVTHNFDLTADMVAEIKEQLVQVRDDLWSLRFLEREPCRQCETCAVLLPVDANK